MTNDEWVRLTIGANKAKLVTATRKYDQRCERAEIRAGRRVNIYRAGIILGRIDDIVARVENGEKWRAAIIAETNDRLRDNFLKAIGEPIYQHGE